MLSAGTQYLLCSKRLCILLFIRWPSCSSRLEAHVSDPRKYVWERLADDFHHPHCCIFGKRQKCMAIEQDVDLQKILVKQAVRKHTNSKGHVKNVPSI